MDPDELDSFVKLKESLHLHLIAVIGGMAWALQLVVVDSTINGFEIFPKSIRELAKSCALMVLSRRIFAGAALWSEQHRNDYQTQRGRAMSKRRQYLQVGLRGLSLLVAFGYLCPRSHWLDTPLSYSIRHPSWTLWLGYHALLSFLISFYTPHFTMGYVGPSLIPTFAAIFLYPLQIAMNWRRRRLSATVVAPLKESQVLPEYKYQPITDGKRFRILKLTPAPGRIRATLEEATADSCPPYWAVSYVWGSGERTHSLAVFNADGTQGHLRITRSCANVIGLLTPLSKPRCLWIDAICINQNDPSDKVSQIPLMATIYSGAAQVVGCLFPPEFWFLIYLGQTFVTEILRFPPATLLGPKHLLPIHWRVRDWSALVEVIQDSYWNRAWIIQEICLARKLVFLVNDPYTYFTWDQFCPALKNLYALIQLDKVSNVKSFSRIHPAFYMLITRMSDRLDMLEDLKADIQSDNRADWPVLADVVDRLYTAESTNPRDQVFALLSLASDGQAPELRPSYEQSISHREVLCKTAVYFFEQGHIHVLLIAGLAGAYEGCDRPVPDLPSWVPVLPKPHRPRLGNRAAKRAKARTCRLTYHVSEDYRVLGIHGAVFDELAAVVVNPIIIGPPTSSKGEGDSEADSGETEAMSKYRHIATQLPGDLMMSLLGKIPLFLVKIGLTIMQHHNPSQEGVTEETHSAATEPCSLEDAMFGLLSGLVMCDSREDMSDLFPGMDDVFIDMVALLLEFFGQANPRAEIMAATMIRLIARVSGVIDGLNFDQETMLRYLGRDCGGHGLAHLSNYHFALTVTGCVAWVPPGAQAGDKVCFLDGLDEVPFLLRPVPEVGGAEKEDRFELVGDTWVQCLAPRSEELESRWLKVV
ncbi:hypothetical protein ACJ41O_005544 [Fusarium nematophilum]